jgi:hypothetical protein
MAARWHKQGRQRHLQEEETQPGTKAGITSSKHDVAVANDGVPPRLEGRGIHRGEGKLVLTLVAMGRSVGVGEVERCMLAGVEGDDSTVQRKQRKVAHGDDPVRLPLHELL